MATITITKSYADGDALFELDLDNIKDGIETFLNTTKINDDNIQNAGITASSKVIDGTITGVKLNSNVVDDSTIELTSNTLTLKDAAVSTAKIVDNAVTPAKLSTLANTTPAGSVQMFHTFNGAVSIPRGWMKLNGDVVNQTNYDALHGSGAYTTDGIASSALLNKNLPNMTSKFAIGSSTTTQDGSSAITSTGNANNEISLLHDHGPGDLRFNVLDYNGTGVDDEIGNNAGLAVDIDSSTAVKGAGIRGINFDTGTQVISQDWYTISGNSLGNTDTALSSTTDVTPESIQFIYIMRVI